MHLADCGAVRWSLVQIARLSRLSAADSTGSLKTLDKKERLPLNTDSPAHADQV